MTCCIMTRQVFFLLILIFVICIKCEIQSGPDGWNEDVDESLIGEDMDIPPDLKLSPAVKPLKNAPSKEERFFRRMLAIVLKGGQTKKNVDNTIDIKLQMKFDEKQWNLLDEYISSESIFTDDMFRRILGYIEEAIFTPSLIEEKIIAWSEHIQVFFVENKTFITSGLAIMGLTLGVIWFFKNVAYHHKLMMGFFIFYLYEVLISYKEAEKKELDHFISAMNSCKWRFWSSGCDVPSPDPLIFIKHMNPLRIGIRMFTSIISEPMIALSATMKTMVEGIADGLWYPFDKIFYGILIIFFNVILLVIMLMVLFNFVLNVPFNFNLWGLMSLRVNQRQRANSVVNGIPHRHVQPAINDTISQPTLNRILDILDNKIPNRHHQPPFKPSGTPSPPLQIKAHSVKTGMKRSASTGRLGNPQPENVSGDQKIYVHHNGGGDAHPRFAL